MEHFILENDFATEVDKKGIITAKSTKKFLYKPDLVILPLLAYDYQGNRVGYGKGYYDRFLAQIPNIPKIGLSFFKPVEQISDIQIWDVTLDYCITPETIYSFNLSNSY